MSSKLVLGAYWLAAALFFATAAATAIFTPDDRPMIVLWLAVGALFGALGAIPPRRGSRPDGDDPDR